MGSDRNTIRCNMCGGEWLSDDDLALIRGKTFPIPNGKTDTEWFKGCPDCGTDEYLMDIEEGVEDGE